MPGASNEIRIFERRLQKVIDAPIARDVVELLADEWIDTAVKKVGKDTYLLTRSTKVESVTGSPAKALAVLVSDTDYAGFHNFGTRFQPPNRYWDMGLERAEQLADRLGAPIGTEIGRMIASGGAWHMPNGSGV
jgi:hypothetical protein